MSWAGYDDWKCHGYKHKCSECGNTWQDFEGGCTYCAELEEEEELEDGVNMIEEMVSYWSCEDPNKYALGREYASEYPARMGAKLRGEYVVKVSYSLCAKEVVYKPKSLESKKDA